MPFHPDALTRPVLKSLVHALQKAAPEVLGHPMAQHQAQELLARQLGYAHWHEAYARAGTLARPNAPVAPPPSPLDADHEWTQTCKNIQMRSALYVDDPSSLASILDFWFDEVASLAARGAAHYLTLQIDEHDCLWLTDDGQFSFSERIPDYPRTPGGPQPAEHVLKEALNRGPWRLPLALLPSAELFFHERGQHSVALFQQGRWMSQEDLGGAWVRPISVAVAPGHRSPGLRLVAPLGQKMAPNGQPWISKENIEALHLRAALYAQLVPGFVITLISSDQSKVHHRREEGPLIEGSAQDTLAAWAQFRPARNCGLIQAAIHRQDTDLIKFLRRLPRSAPIHDLLDLSLPPTPRRRRQR